MLKIGSRAIPATRPTNRRRTGGFSLLEVLVALIVLSVGLLGILKLEAAAVASTTVASQRSLAALEASSLASSMHVNRGYWTNSDAAGATIKATGTTVSATILAPNLATALGAGTVNCASNVATGACSVTNMAAYDLQQWAGVLQNLLPNYSAVISCGIVSPVTCMVTINWTENAVGINAQEAAAQAAATANTPQTFANPSYTTYIEP